MIKHFWLKISFGFVMLTFMGCDKTPHYFPLEIVCDAPISSDGKYPTYLQSIFKPFDIDDEKFGIPKPIKFKRVDINNVSFDINAFAFENRGEPTFDLFSEWLPAYFKDSLPHKDLIAAKGNAGSIDTWLSKPDNQAKTIVIYQNGLDKPNIDSKNISFCETPECVLGKLSELLKSNLQTSVSLVILSQNKPQGPPDDTIPPSDPLLAALTRMATDQLSFETRIAQIEPTLKSHFSDKSFVRVIGNDGTFVKTRTAKQYLNEITGYITLQKIEIMEKKADETGRVYSLILKEYHK